MPKTLKKDIFETWAIDGDSATWTLAKKAMIDVDNIPAIRVLDTSTGNRLDIEGKILATNDFGVGVNVLGDDTRVVIGRTAEIDATWGITATAAGLKVVNKGTIDSDDHGVSSNEALTLRNTGEISADYAVMASGSGRIVNGKNGEILGDTAGIVTGSGVNTVVINHGMISGDTYGVSIGGGDANRLVNTGTIDGRVQFFDGNDLVDTRKGTITGMVYGGDGDDVFKIGKQDIDITEYEDGGSDRIEASVSHTLSEHVEVLYLVGNKDADGQGNDGNNYIRGNKGDNTMTGGDGDDYVGGGGGDDMLIGDGGEDIFVFRRGNDRDTIGDFAQSEDLIWITGFENVENFTELAARMSQHGADTWINMGKGDRLVIENVDKDDLEAGDFSFLEFPV